MGRRARRRDRSSPGGHPPEAERQNLEARQRRRATRLKHQRVANRAASARVRARPRRSRPPSPPPRGRGEKRGRRPPSSSPTAPPRKSETPNRRHRSLSADDLPRDRNPRRHVRRPRTGNLLRGGTGTRRTRAREFPRTSSRRRAGVFLRRETQIRDGLAVGRAREGQPRSRGVLRSVPRDSVGRYPRARPRAPSIGAGETPRRLATATGTTSRRNVGAGAGVDTCGTRFRARTPTRPVPVSITTRKRTRWSPVAGRRSPSAAGRTTWEKYPLAAARTFPARRVRRRRRARRRRRPRVEKQRIHVRG